MSTPYKEYPQLDQTEDNDMNINGVCIASTEDEHGPIYVYQTRTSRILTFNREVQQSCMQLDDINGLAHGYTQAMMCALLFIPEPATATIMGLGGGSMAKNLLHSFTDVKVHAVEYRLEIINIARKYFHLPEDTRLHIHTDDALTYMQQSPPKSDIIFSDLYTTDGMESKQVQADYLYNCKHALNKHGILALNIWQQAIHIPEFLERALSNVFKDRLLRFDVESGNTIVLAFRNNIPAMKRKTLLDKAKVLQEKMNIPLERHTKLLWSRQQDKFKPE